MNKYRTIFISDIHLGSRHCKADILLKFLKEYKCDTLYLIGDIIDFWKLKRKFRITAQQVAVIQKILKLSKKGTAIKYVLGNHDAVQACLYLDRNKVYENSSKWTWENCWKIFKENLIKK